MVADGQRIGFYELTDNRLLNKSASGAGEESTILQSQQVLYINDWSPYGRYIVYTQQSPERRSELWLLPLIPILT